MTRKISIYLDDILESIEKINNFTKDVNKEEFYANEEKQYAVIRGIEIMGEAARNIPEEFKMKNPDIPWKKINAMRNILIHTYDKVDIEEVWRVIKKDLQELKKKIAVCKEQISGDN